MRRIIFLGIFLTLAWTEPAMQEEYDKIVKEVRCVTCPNQSIADSQAPIAVAMREDIARRIEAGGSEESIREHLLVRYGEYITYRPLFQKETWLLWGGPIGFFLIGVVFWLKAIYKRGKS